MSLRTRDGLRTVVAAGVLIVRSISARGCSFGIFKFVSSRKSRRREREIGGRWGIRRGAYDLRWADIGYRHPGLFKAIAILLRLRQALRRYKTCRTVRDVQCKGSEAAAGSSCRGLASATAWASSLHTTKSLSPLPPRIRPPRCLYPLEASQSARYEQSLHFQASTNIIKRPVMPPRSLQ